MTITGGTQPRSRLAPVRTTGGIPLLVIILVVLCFYALFSAFKVHEVSSLLVPHLLVPHLPELDNAIGPCTSKSKAQDILDRLADNAAIQRQERDAWFDAARAHHVRHRNENANLANLDLGTFYGGVMLQPSSACPADLMKTSSVRDVFDGGKWLCGASLLSNTSAYRDRPCVVYSLGCNFETSFERTIQQISGGSCDVHVYDPTLKPPDRVRKFAEEMKRERIYLHEVAVRGTSGHSTIRIGDGEYEAQGIGTMFETNGHGCVDILKFDVEGAEYDILEDTDWSSLCIGMILFELHGGMIRDQRRVDYTVRDGIRHVRRLEEAGFQHYKTEQVWVGGHAQAELAFVNYTWLLPALQQRM